METVTCMDEAGWQARVREIAQARELTYGIVYAAAEVGFVPAGPYARTPAYVKDAFARIRHHLNHDAPETVTDDQVRAFAQDLAVPARPHEDPRTNFEIPAVNEPTLLARLAKITAKAKRLHVAGPVVTRTGEFE